MYSADGIYASIEAIRTSNNIVLLLGRNSFRGENTEQWFGSLASSILTNNLILQWTPNALLQQFLDDFLRDDKIARQKSSHNVYDLVKQCFAEGKNVHIITDSCSDSIFSFGPTNDQVIFLRGSITEVLKETSTITHVHPKFHQSRVHNAITFVKTVPVGTLFVCVETGSDVFQPIINNIPTTSYKMYLGTNLLIDESYRYVVHGDPNDICEEIAKSVKSLV